MTWVLDTTDVSGSSDSDRADQSIGYLVSGGYSLAQVQRDPTSILGGDGGSEPLPAYGSVHPENDKLILDRYTGSQDGATLRIRGLYSSDGSGKIPVVVPIPPNRFIYGREVVQWELPFAQREPHELTDAFSGGTTIIMAWIPKAQQVVQKFQLREYTVRVDADQIDAANAAAVEQDKRLHLLAPGMRWRFSFAGDAQYVPADDKYELRYRWTFDPGWTIPVSGATSPAGFNFPSLVDASGVPGPTGTYTRPPNFLFAPPARSDDLTVPPIYTLIPSAVADDNGWQSLIGLT